ncbi:MAG: hypothetical protein CVU14_00410 [Bacteroidetes bacterium HGW-Bacteroidetes-9]|jgi:hypothetical protein|nr:MAG: hypothetical protein CVU14_00410 [Bacteroidetes bacterium HGW-Bacteroidetes-9]
MKKLRKYHKWPSLIIGLFLILFSISGIVMNHRQLFSGVNVSRKLMPPVYSYKNWNLAAIKGSLPIENNRQLVYGNIGIWETDSAFNQFYDFNSGFSKGIDHKKIFTMLRTSDQQLYAGSLFGLYHFNKTAKRWQKIALPENNPRIVKLVEYQSQLWVMTRDQLYTMDTRKGKAEFKKITPGIPESADGKVGLFTSLWVIHSGELLGIPGKLLVDLVGLILVFITLSGFYYTLLPKFAKRIRSSIRLRLQKFNRSSIKWHTKIGIYALIILLITVISGMFLRPPLLIPIANSRVNPIPGSVLNNRNHWHDKLRDFVIDSANQRLIFSTSEGFFETNLGAENFCRPFRTQPPVSVMGITAFEYLDDGALMVGSFSGLFRWYPERNVVIDMITGKIINETKQGNPFGATAVTGVISKNSIPVAIVDYDAGWIPLGHEQFAPKMPAEISGIPVSLWNVALEVHTGRIFSVILGDFYILYVPLMGLTTLLIIITGTIMWYRARKRKKKKSPIKENCNENYQTARSA